MRFSKCQTRRSSATTKNGEAFAILVDSFVRCAVQAMALVATSWCAAQEVAIAPFAPRDTVTLQSGYFSGDYGNNVDYADVVLDQGRAVGRLAQWSYDKYRDKLDSPWARAGLLVGVGATNLLLPSSLAYHEWGHASRHVALGGSAEFSKCLESLCPAPRDFFGLTLGLLFRSSASTWPKGVDKANHDSGAATGAISSGAGVNNDISISELSDEHKFFTSGQGGANPFDVHLPFAIALYGGGKDGGDSDDIKAVARKYRLTGIDPNIQSDDLRKINLLSLFSGSVVSNVMAKRSFVVGGTAFLQPWLINGFLVPNQYNYLSSRGITRKWVSGYAVSDSLKILGSYESVVRGEDYAEIGLGAYKDFGTWEVSAKVTGKDLDTLNLEAAASTYVAKDWKLGLKAYVWDSRSLLGERNTLDFSKNKTQQISVALSYVY